MNTGATRAAFILYPTITFETIPNIICVHFLSFKGKSLSIIIKVGSVMVVVVVIVVVIVVAAAAVVGNLQ